jgi:hypothetical protein
MKQLALIVLSFAGLALADTARLYPSDLRATDTAQLQRVAFYVSRHVVILGGLLARPLGSLRHVGEDAIADSFADWEEVKPKLPPVVVAAYNPCFQMGWNALPHVQRAIEYFQSRAGTQVTQEAINYARNLLWQAKTCREKADAYLAGVLQTGSYPSYRGQAPAVAAAYYGNGRWLLTGADGHQYYWEEGRGDGILPPPPPEIATLNPAYRGNGFWEYTLPDGRRSSLIVGELDDANLFPRVAPTQITTNACPATAPRRPGTARPPRCVQRQSDRIFEPRRIEIVGGEKWPELPRKSDRIEPRRIEIVGGEKWPNPPRR